LSWLTTNVVDVVDKSGTGFIQQEEIMRLLKRLSVGKPCLILLMEMVDVMDLVIEREDLEEEIQKWRSQLEEERREGTTQGGGTGWKSVKVSMTSPSSPPTSPPLSPQQRSANEDKWAQREAEARDEVRRKRRADIERAKAHDSSSASDDTEGSGEPIPIPTKTGSPKDLPATAVIDDPMGVFSSSPPGFTLATSGRGSPPSPGSRGAAAAAPTKLQIEKEKEDKWKNRKVGDKKGPPASPILSSSAGGDNEQAMRSKQNELDAANRKISKLENEMTGLAREGNRDQKRAKEAEAKFQIKILKLEEEIGASSMGGLPTPRSLHSRDDAMDVLQEELDQQRMLNEELKASYSGIEAELQDLQRRQAPNADAPPSTEGPSTGGGSAQPGGVEKLKRQIESLEFKLQKQEKEWARKLEDCFVSGQDDLSKSKLDHARSLEEIKLATPGKSGKGGDTGGADMASIKAENARLQSCLSRLEAEAEGARRRVELQSKRHDTKMESLVADLEASSKLATGEERRAKEAIEEVVKLQKQLTPDAEALLLEVLLDELDDAIVQSHPMIEPVLATARNRRHQLLKQAKEIVTNPKTSKASEEPSEEAKPEPAGKDDPKPEPAWKDDRGTGNDLNDLIQTRTELKLAKDKVTRLESLVSRADEALEKAEQENQNHASSVHAEYAMKLSTLEEALSSSHRELAKLEGELSQARILPAKEGLTSAATAALKAQLGDAMEENSSMMEENLLLEREIKELRQMEGKLENSMNELLSKRVLTPASPSSEGDDISDDLAILALELRDTKQELANAQETVANLESELSRPPVDAPPPSPIVAEPRGAPRGSPKQDKDRASALLASLTPSNNDRVRGLEAERASLDHELNETKDQVASLNDILIQAGEEMKEVKKERLKLEKEATAREQELEAAKSALQHLTEESADKSPIAPVPGGTPEPSPESKLKAEQARAARVHRLEKDVESLTEKVEALEQEVEEAIEAKSRVAGEKHEIEINLKAEKATTKALREEMEAKAEEAFEATEKMVDMEEELDTLKSPAKGIGGGEEESEINNPTTKSPQIAAGSPPGGAGGDTLKPALDIVDEAGKGILELESSLDEERREKKALSRALYEKSASLEQASAQLVQTKNQLALALKSNQNKGQEEDPNEAMQTVPAAVSGAASSSSPVSLRGLLEGLPWAFAVDVLDASNDHHTKRETCALVPTQAALKRYVDERAGATHAGQSLSEHDRISHENLDDMRLWRTKDLLYAAERIGQEREREVDLLRGEIQDAREAAPEGASQGEALASNLRATLAALEADLDMCTQRADDLRIYVNARENAVEAWVSAIEAGDVSAEGGAAKEKDRLGECHLHFGDVAEMRIRRVKHALVDSMDGGKAEARLRLLWSELEMGSMPHHSPIRGIPGEAASGGEQVEILRQESAAQSQFIELLEKNNKASQSKLRNALDTAHGEIVELRDELSELRHAKGDVMSTNRAVHVEIQIEKENLQAQLLETQKEASKLKKAKHRLGVELDASDVKLQDSIVEADGLRELLSSAWKSVEEADVALAGTGRGDMEDIRGLLVGDTGMHDPSTAWSKLKASGDAQLEALQSYVSAMYPIGAHESMSTEGSVSSISRPPPQRKNPRAQIVDTTQPMPRTKLIGTVSRPTFMEQAAKSMEDTPPLPRPVGGGSMQGGQYMGQEINPLKKKLRAKKSKPKGGGEEGLHGGGCKGLGSQPRSDSLSALIAMDLDAAFDSLDKNGDGKISIKEFAAGVDLGNIGFPPAREGGRKNRGSSSKPGGGPSVEPICKVSGPPSGPSSCSGLSRQGDLEALFYRLAKGEACIGIETFSIVEASVGPGSSDDTCRLCFNTLDQDPLGFVRIDAFLAYFMSRGADRDDSSFHNACISIGHPPLQEGETTDGSVYYLDGEAPNRTKDAGSVPAQPAAAEQSFISYI